MSERANARTAGLKNIKSIQAFNTMKEGYSIVFSASLTDGTKDSIVFSNVEYQSLSLATFQRDLVQWFSRLPSLESVGWCAKDGNKIVEQYSVCKERWL